MVNIENIEKSACGVGFVVSRNGSYSNEILQKTLLALRCQEHRGGCSADMITADGSGIMTDIPFEMLGYEKGDIAVASLFLPVDPERRRISVHHFEEIFNFMGMKILEYRDVPIDKSVLGKQALELLPPMVHAIIKRPSHCRTDYSFDKLLYQANMFNRMRQKEIFPGRPREFFFNSLSANTIVYKGLTRASDLERFYLDLQNPNFKTRFGMFHRRFSTNTVSTWDKVQPFRLVGHNGEINTIEGNRSNAFSREKSLGLRKEELLTREGISDSGSLNEMVEAMAYRSSMHDMEDVLAIMMPPAKLDKAYYKFWSRVMEPWDGPAMITYSNGKKLGARLDRNGFRPCRWAMTDDFFYLSSEAGSFHLDESVIKQKGTLNAGTGVVADLVTGDINFNDPSESKLNVEAIFDPRLVPLVHLEPKQTHAEHLDKKYLFSYTEEDISRILIPMMSTGKEPIGSMGDTARLAVFSDEPRSFFDYFFQNFAQVTNPPLDYIREKNVTDLVTYLGKKPNIFAKKELLPPTKAFELESPILSLGQMEFVRSLENPEVSDFQVISHELDMTFKREHGSVGFQNALDLLAKQAVDAVNNKKASVLIISDRKASHDRLPIPSLLALRSVVQGLTEAGVRLEASVVVDSAEIKTTHHVACLIGFGATAVCPYLALEIGRFEEGHKISKLELDPDVKEKNLIHCYEIGLLKIMSKMGISVARSYQSAKLFSVIGLGKKIMENYFPKVPSYIGGLEIKEVVENVIKFAAQSQKFAQEEMLVNNFLFREDTVGTSGEKHSMTLSRSKMIHKLVRDTGVGLNNMALYNEYLKAGIDNTPVNVRHLFKLKKRKSIPISEVESIESIMTRFGSGAMSFGAISAESQRDIILAMREIGGRSNSGEGGENPYYFTEGISASTKQVASGRFGVTALYLIGGSELQIKVAQGAKPGEGGQLMGIKVNADIARARYSNPNVDLISPPPLHDIYSIEDLKQLIYELKQINPTALVNVKLVSGVNIGTIAVGVAKAGADVIDVAGGDGGTGAAGLTSMKHAGLPFEFGLVEVHRALAQNDLRKNVKVRTDGGLSTGEDIVMAALMGAEQYNFGKLLLVAEGCVMARICEKNTCPAGITTHDPVYKAKYKGTKDNVVKLMKYIAEDVRKHLAEMGFRSLSEVIGQTDLLEINPVAEKLIKERNLDLTYILGKSMPDFQQSLNPFFEGINDLNKQIIEDTRETIKNNASGEFSYEIQVTDRAVLATLAGEIAKTENDYRMAFYTNKTLYPYTNEIKLTFKGSAGQGFGVFLCDGMNVKLYGEANDSVAKGMSGGSMTIVPPSNANFEAEKNVIIGNCALYGATGGYLFVKGLAADRFAVRNSGAFAVVEGVGLHGCEYMTNGKVAILGEFSENLGSGMTGGEVYLYKPSKPENINREYIVEADFNEDNWYELYNLLENYWMETGSKTAGKVVSDWENEKHNFVKFIPLNMVKKKKVISTLVNA